ncbi:MAG: hypothetical protein E7675_00320 [Ruminococcaceae bacterium]|nr:hypothetical protein [Oscillospiraceae bacterium]
MLQYRKIDNEKDLILRKEKRFFGKTSMTSMTGRQKIEVCGCMGLQIYRDELIQIRLCDGVMRITGAGLTLKNYFGGRMIISGRIDKTEFFECEV